MRRGTKLSTRILVSQLTILIIAMAIGFGLYARHTGDQLDRQYEQRALAIAQSTAGLPQIQQALVTGSDPGGTVRTLAEQIRRSAGAAYVVVVDRSGVRLSHPNPALIGQPVEEPVVALDGRDHVGVDPGSLGPSANGKTPVFGPDGHPVGEVSAGIPEREVSGQVRQELPAIALYTTLALAFGSIVSLLLAHRLKKTTFGLELHEIAALLQEREAMLHGVREGVVTFAVDGHITLINDEARRLLGLRVSAVGKQLTELLPAGRLRDVLSGEISGSDQVVLTAERCLLVNRMMVGAAGRPLGSVVTLRDRTEIESLLRELSSARGLTDALRAQQHEFSNRMHTVVGLLSLGESDEALSYLTDTTEAVDGFAESVSAKIADSVVAALIVAKATVAAERAVTLLLTDDSRMRRRLPQPHEVVTVLGNLLDNAIDAAAHGPAPGHVTVRLADDGGGLTIRVSDTGPGIPADVSESIFQAGFTTKSAGQPAEGRTREAGHQGLGLALVRQIVQRMGGTVTVTEGPGPVFTVRLPERAIAALSGATS